MKKFRFAFKTSAYIVYGLLVAVCLVGIIINALMLAEVGAFIATFPELEITAIVFLSVFFVFLSAIFFSSSYTFKEDFSVNFLFVRQKIAKSDILLLAMEAKSNTIVLYYRNADAPDGRSFIIISIRRKSVQDFINAMQTFSPNVEIIFEENK